MKRTTLVFAAAALGLPACVDSFAGSNLLLTLSGGVHIPGEDAPGAPPAGTHYTFYAVDYVLDDTGAAESSYAFKVIDFEVRQVIDLESPCFIEDEEARFPGLHVTYALERLGDDLANEYGIASFDPFAPPAGVDEGDVIDYLTARERNGNLQKLQSRLRAITSHSPVRYPQVAADCGEPTADSIPPPHCTDDASNEKRARLCQAFWAEHPGLYEGNDKVLTLPLNGTLHGMVDGSDPRSGQSIGGASVFVEANLATVEGILVNWQYDCDPQAHAADPDGCAPVIPDDAPASLSPIGGHYLAGELESRTRGVRNATLANRLFPTINGEVAVFADLGDDDHHF